MRARLRLELNDTAGRTLAVRAAHNSVMRGGAQLVADLFAGKGTPITHMGVGTSDDPESDGFVTTTLHNESVGGLPALAGTTETPIPSEAFVISTDEPRRLVTVRIHATLAPDQAVGTVRESGLLARNGEAATLYNRVIFAPLVKGDDHELTMFWEVSFPYGDLQWLQ
jgi:hypothetical protein